MNNIKEKLIEQIKKTEDPEIIEHLYALLELELDIKGSKEYDLSNDEINALNEAEEDIKNGKLLSEEEANKKSKKWTS
jgi:hypothetical protein